MDYSEENQWITMLVHQASTKEEAQLKFASLEGIYMPKHLAESIFNAAVKEKFDVIHDSKDAFDSNVRKLESKLKKELV